MSTLNPLNTILCEKCDGQGTLENEGVRHDGIVCDGDPCITYAYVESLAEQVDAGRKRILLLEGLTWTYYANHQAGLATNRIREGYCDCGTCRAAREWLHLQDEDLRTSEERKAEALADIGDDKYQERRGEEICE
jgi:hypothetical protein